MIKIIESNENISFDDIEGSWEVPDSLKETVWKYFKNYCLTSQDWENYKKWKIKCDTEMKKFYSPSAYGNDYYYRITLYTGINEYVCEQREFAPTWEREW